MNANTPSSQEPIREALDALDAAERDALAHTWQTVQPDGTWPGVDAQRHADVRASLQAAIRAEPPPKSNPALRRAPLRRARRRQFAWAGAAAAFVLLVVAGLGLDLHRTTITAPPDLASTIQFPDHSSIELRPGSVLSYSRLSMGAPQQVVLAGEAYFTITPGTRFRVQTTNAHIDVLGTQFNVKASAPTGAAGALTEVYLTEGRVALTGRAAEQRVTLAPGDVSRVVDGQAPVAPSAASHADLPLWRARQFTFAAGAPLRDVLAAIEGSYGLRVHVHDPVLLEAQLPFQYLGRNILPAPQLLEDLCQILGLTYRPTSDGFEIMAVPRS